MQFDLLWADNRDHAFHNYSIFTSRAGSYPRMQHTAASTHVMNGSEQETTQLYHQRASQIITRTQLVQIKRITFCHLKQSITVAQNVLISVWHHALPMFIDK
jgi:hypothetical protein